MAEFIPRDVANPFVLFPNPAPGSPEEAANEHNLAEFEGFASDVPNTDGMIAAVTGVPTIDPDTGLPEPITRANIVRAAKLFVPSLVQGLVPDPESGELNLPTPDFIPANTQPPGRVKTFGRQGLHSNPGLSVPGLGEVPMGGFQDTLNDVQAWPAPMIRVREGDLVHSTLSSQRGPHTIHHHGIEPTAMNDGVGHLTFEVAGGVYTYQWLAAASGTYFYHCHRNTVLHFELGMYGPMIIDPDVDGAPFQTGGPGQTHVADSIVDYAAEALWVVDDIDTRWHAMGAAPNPGPNNAPLITDLQAGIQAPDDDALSGFTRIQDSPRLHDFNPNVFAVTGVAAPFIGDNAVVGTVPGSVVTPQVTRGQSLLLRTLNASYTTTRWRFLPGPNGVLLPGQVIAADGRTLGRSPFSQYSSPYTLASINHQFALVTAQRWDILIDTATVPTGTYEVEVAFHHWVTDQRLRRLRLQIVVA